MRQVYQNAWTREEDDLLTPHLCTGLSSAEFAAIAAKINRTWCAVEGRFYQLKRGAGLIKPRPAKQPQPAPKAPSNRGQPFTQEDDAKIIEWHEAKGLGFTEIGRRLGRDVDTIRHRYDRLAAGQARRPVIVHRKCLTCDVVFGYDRSDGVPLFMCGGCRPRSGSPYAPGGDGTTGGRVGRPMR